MDEVVPGILHWRAPHPNLGLPVRSYLLTDSGIAHGDPVASGGKAMLREFVEARR